MAGKLFTGEALEQVINLAEEMLEIKRSRLARMQHRIYRLQNELDEDTKIVQHSTEAVSQIRGTPLVEQYPTR